MPAGSYIFLFFSRALHQWGHWSPNDFLGLPSQPPSLQPTGGSGARGGPPPTPSHPPSTCTRAPQLARHGQLNAWLASALIVPNQEMRRHEDAKQVHARWGRLCQTVEWSLAENAARARTARRRDCARLSPSLSLSRTLAALHGGWSHIQFTWAPAADLVGDAAVVHCGRTTAHLQIFKARAI